MNLKKYYIETVARYKGRPGQTKAALPYNASGKEAVEVLCSHNRYNDILSFSN